MSNGYFIEYRGKTFQLTREAYKSMAEDLKVQPEEACKEAIDLFIDGNVEFGKLHLFISVRQNGDRILNFMALL